MSATDEGLPEVSIAEAVGEMDAGTSWLEEHDPGDSDESMIHESALGPGMGGDAESPGDADAELSEDESTADTTGEVETDDAPEEEAESGEEDGAYEKAISALRRAKLSKGVIGKLTRAEVLQEGLAMAEGQAATDAKFDEHSRVVNELKQARDGKESGEEPGDVESTGHPSPATLGAVTKEFAEVFGLEEEAVGPVLNSLTGAVTGPIQKQMTQGVEVLTQLDQIVGSLLFRAARTELSSGEHARYPQLADAKVSAQVQEKAQQLLSGGSYSHMDHLDARVEAMSDAAGILLRPALKQEAATRVTKDRAARTRGSARRPGGSKDVQPLTEFGQASQILDKLERAGGG